MTAMRAAFPVAVALVVVACSGAGNSNLYGPHGGDGGGGSGSGSGGSSSGSGGGLSSSGGSSGSSSGGTTSSTSSGGVGDDESDATSPPPQDASVDVGPACVQSPPSGSACNSLVAPASSISVTCNATEAVPAPVGGTIRDGTYHLISATFYADNTACPTPETDGVVWDICGTSWQISQNDAVNGAAQPQLIANLTVVAAASDLTITVDCGIPGETMPLVYGYDADATSLRLHIGGGTTATSGRVDTFARQ